TSGGSAGDTATTGLAGANDSAGTAHDAEPPHRSGPEGRAQAQAAVRVRGAECGAGTAAPACAPARAGIPAGACAYSRSLMGAPRAPGALGRAIRPETRQSASSRSAMIACGTELENCGSLLHH